MQLRKTHAVQMEPIMDVVAHTDILNLVHAQVVILITSPAMLIVDQVVATYGVPMFVNQILLIMIVLVTIWVMLHIMHVGYVMEIIQHVQMTVVL